MKIIVYTKEENLSLIDNFLNSNILYDHNIYFSLYREKIDSKNIVEILLDYEQYLLLQDFISNVPEKFKNIDENTDNKNL